MAMTHRRCHRIGLPDTQGATVWASDKNHLHLFATQDVSITSKAGSLTLKADLHKRTAAVPTPISLFRFFLALSFPARVVGLDFQQGIAEPSKRIKPRYFFNWTRNSRTDKCIAQYLAMLRGTILSPPPWQHALIVREFAHPTKFGR